MDRSALTTDDGVVRPPRRIPTQARSRKRVEALLDAASHLVVRDGVEALTTRTIATEATMPVASLYQYFADKDAILLALVERDMNAMDNQVERDLAALHDASLDAIVRTIMGAFVTIFQQRPAFIEIYLHGRTNAAVMDYCRAHNVGIALKLYDMAQSYSLLIPQARFANIRLAIEMGDRVLQVAFESDRNGDQLILSDGVELITAYLRKYAQAPFH